MLDDLGYKITELHAGKFKTEWSPYKPLSPEAVADMQPRLEAVHSDFLSAVSGGRGRRASSALVKSKFGGGRMFSGRQALAGGLVDRLQAPREFYRGLASGKTAPTVSASARRPTLSPVMSSGGVSLRRARLELERARV